MRLFAISDLHLHYEENRRALVELPPHRDDWLIVAGDVGHRLADLELAWQVLAERFARVVWAPGNHELWTAPNGARELRGEEKYLELVALSRRYGVLTPEDDYAAFPHDGRVYRLAPLFLLYDYSFRPEHLPLEEAVPWALEAETLCTDEYYLSPEPHASRAAWCELLCQRAEARLDAVPREEPLVLINHFPLRRDLVQIAIPRFIIWCGTRRTEDWHRRYNVEVVVSGHLHVRTTDWRDDVRFEEVSLGYPRQWQQGKSLASYLRPIFPSDAAPARGRLRLY